MARLTFERDLDLILSLASSIADAFARISGRYDLREDAASDAVVALLGIDFDPDRDGWRSYLKTRAVGLLLRDLQTKTGRRLKVPPAFVPFMESTAPIEEEPDEDAEEEGATSDDDAIRRAIERFAERDRALVRDWIAGKKQIEIARELRLSRGRISQILTLFKNFARFYRRHGGGVAIIDTRDERPTEKEKKRCPLFYERND